MSQTDNAAVAAHPLHVRIVMVNTTLLCQHWQCFTRHENHGIKQTGSSSTQNLSPSRY